MPSAQAPRVARAFSFCLSVGLLYAVSFLAPLSAQTELKRVSGEAVLRNEFWCALESRPDFDIVDPPPPELINVAQRIRQEASFVYSGMLRGFRLRYIPYDRARAIEERMLLEPLAQGGEGRPLLAQERLELKEMRLEADRLHAYVEYPLDGVETRLRAAWLASATAAFGGEGRAPLVGGEENRIKAMEDGLKNAVREYARIKVKNKPSQVRAILAFEKPPSVQIREGNYIAKVRVRIIIEEIIPYAAY